MDRETRYGAILWLAGGFRMVGASKVVLGEGFGVVKELIEEEEGGNMSEQSKELVSRLAKVKPLGFTNLSFDIQWIIFNKARMFGWTGQQPSVLGTHFAYQQLDGAIEYLLAQGISFKKDGGED